MSKKRTKKKVTKKATKPRPLPAGARDIGYRGRKLDEAEAKLQAEVAEVRATVEDAAAPVCAFSGCYTEVADYGDLCVRHMPSEPHVVSEPATDEEIAESNNAVIREAHVPRAPERRTYTPPEPGPVPTLPSLIGRSLEFHKTRQGMYCDIAFTVLPEDGIAIMRVTDRHGRDIPAANYLLAGVADLDAVQSGEVASHHWHHATEEQHAAIEKCVSLDESIAHWRDLAAQEAQDAENHAAQHRAKLYERTVESLVLEKQTGTPHCVDHLEPLPCKIHALARTGRT